MSNELDIIKTEILNQEEKSEFSTTIDRLIESHKNNRQVINKLVFESVAAITEADVAQKKLARKGILERWLGDITGSNQKLQNKINSDRSTAQYAAQLTLQKLAEQNLLTFDLISAVNNKLNASLLQADEELKNIYNGLRIFFAKYRDRIGRLELDLKSVKEKQELNTWVITIKNQKFCGKKYIDLDKVAKIVCLARDFHEKTRGNWNENDLPILDTAIELLALQPKENMNYFDVLREIALNKNLKEKLLGNADIREVSQPGYLITTSVLSKFDSLEHEESYLVETLVNSLKDNGIVVTIEDKCADLTKKYFEKEYAENLDMNVTSYDLILDLLFNLQQFDESIENEGRVFTEPSTAIVQNVISDGIINKNDKNEMKQQQSFNDLLELGKKYYDEQNYEKALGLFKEGAENGNAIAEKYLGNMYFLGKGVNQDYSIALIYWKQAAEQGVATAQFNLGLAYEQGKGVAQDNCLAVKWYEKAAEQGDATAQRKVGLAYYYGRGVQQNYGEAAKWFEKAAEQGDATAQFNLGLAYEQGKGVAQDNRLAVKWYEKAAEQGDVDAQCKVGVAYDYGRGVQQDYSEAAKWFKKAAEQGDATAQFNLGLAYEQGKGVAQDNRLAVRWYEKAAEQGDVDAKCKFDEMRNKDKSLFDKFLDEIFD